MTDIKLYLQPELNHTHSSFGSEFKEVQDPDQSDVAVFKYENGKDYNGTTRGLIIFVEDGVSVPQQAKGDRTEKASGKSVEEIKRAIVELAKRVQSTKQLEEGVKKLSFLMKLKKITSAKGLVNTLVEKNDVYSKQKIKPVLYDEKQVFLDAQDVITVAFGGRYEAKAPSSTIDFPCNLVLIVSDDPSKYQNLIQSVPCIILGHCDGERKLQNFIKVHQKNFVPFFTSQLTTGIVEKSVILTALICDAVHQLNWDSTFDNNKQKLEESLKKIEDSTKELKLNNDEIVRIVNS